MSDHKGMSLSSRILIGMASGAFLGLMINQFASDVVWVNDYITTGLFHAIGKIFIASLQMLVVPLVLVSLICGVSSLQDSSKLGRMGVKTIALYLLTTAIAVALAIMAAYVVGPGIGANFPTAEFTAKEAPPLIDTIINLVPKNPVNAMAEGKMLQIIVFAVLFGLAITQAGKKGQIIAELFQNINEVIMKMVTLIMVIAPYGVFALIAKLMSTLGIESILPLAKYFFLVIAVLLFHGSVTYMLLLKFIAKLDPIKFLKKMRTVQLFAFSTASSGATIPISMETITKRLGVKNSVASFTVPLGATINMDGTAIMQGVATVFIAQVYQIDLSFAQYLTIILTAVLASIGTAAVPGVGLITLTMVLQQVGLPIQGIALIIGVDRILDMVRTSVNVTGDATVSCIVAQGEGDFDKAIFEDPEAGLDFEEVDLPDIEETA
ncbi:MAG: dicarboxylate/amino acid:cation symporter, partial [Gammaproteobacteria bacterium]|nr:dicarboxylate/amino acid:cation symporter [Gammaproteobacteria bacterium]